MCSVALAACLAAVALPAKSEAGPFVFRGGPYDRWVGVHVGPYYDPWFAPAPVYGGYYVAPSAYVAGPVTTTSFYTPTTVYTAPAATTSLYVPATTIYYDAPARLYPVRRWRW
jgi:hypothetical protein